MKPIEKWQKDLAAYAGINTVFIVEGNVHDYQPWIYDADGACESVPLSQYLQRYLSETGYDPIAFYNRIDGFDNPYSADMTAAFYRLVGSDERSSKSICSASELIRKAMTNETRPTAIVLDLANTVATTPDNLSDVEIEFFTRLMLASKDTRQGLSVCNNKPLFNMLILVVEKANDIPAWFYLNNPYVRTLTIQRPDKDVRATVIDARFDSLDGAEVLSQEERASACSEFVALTDGMTLVELFGIFSLCRRKSYTALQIREAVKMFRYGETESHWDKLDAEKVKNAEKYLGKRVKGQTRAVRKASEVLSRACLGLTGIQGGPSSRPKGILFLAGPTGTGKTELAKTIAEFVFGDESFVTRFDMSEYQQPHSDQKLLGAPPGYVGYAEGGQLTNAIKAKPFCVLLFDEIDKAHPSILDKFLQILEDGRITDSSGETVYFSEALIVFTSNLGVVSDDVQTGKRCPTIMPEMDYETIQDKLLSEIKDYFKYTIRRPELLNRIGDNFVVFDFIREEAAKQILELKLQGVKEFLIHEKGLSLEISEEFYNQLFAIINKDLSNGGRGIGNAVETYLINPMSNLLMQEPWSSGHTLCIQGIGSDESQPLLHVWKE